MNLAGFTSTFQQHTRTGIAIISQIALNYTIAAVGSPVVVMQKA